MKTKLFLLFAFCFFLTVQSQPNPDPQQTKPTDTKSGVVFGLKAGGNAIFTKTGAGDKNQGFGFQAGFTLGVPFSQKFSFQPELMFQLITIKYGYTNQYSNGVESQDINQTNSYVQLPLNVRYAVSRKFEVELGPNIGFLAGYKEEVRNTFTDNSGNLVVNDVFKRTDSSGNKVGFGANLGTNYNFTESLYANFRYTLFISRFQTADDTLNNSVFSLSLGYKF